TATGKRTLRRRESSHQPTGTTRAASGYPIALPVIDLSWNWGRSWRAAAKTSRPTRAAFRARSTARAVDRARTRTRRLEAEWVEGLGARGEEHALRLEVEVERVDRELATEARLLVAAERDAREGGERHVDPDHPRLERTRDAMPTRGIARPDRGEEAVPDVVRDPDCILLVLERDRGHHRPEDLLLRNGHRARYTREHGRHVERPRAVAGLAAEHDLGSFF